jgi:arylsulfatase A-like enzyme
MNETRWVLCVAIVVTLSASLLPITARAQRQTPSKRSPNIILILADDLGYNEVGANGQKKIRTPNIDRLAREGVRLTDHYSGSPVCAPSRAVLLTGLHTGHAYIRDNDEMGDRGDVWRDLSLEGQRPLPAGTLTIASMLKRAGYAGARRARQHRGADHARLRPVLRVPVPAHRPQPLPAVPVAQHDEGSTGESGHLPSRETACRQGSRRSGVIRALQRKAVRAGHDGGRSPGLRP